MSIELYPSIAKVKRNGVYENLPGFIAASGDIAVEEMIAKSESSATAQYVHYKGEYFILNDTLYNTTAKISVGDSIVVGTNCEVAVIADDLSKVTNAYNDVTEYNAKTEVTDDLNSTRYGVTFTRVDDNTIHTKGTANSARRVLWLNGQDAGMTTSSNFQQTLPAGTYKLTYSASGIAAATTIQRTYTKFNTYSILFAGNTTGTSIVTFTDPVMIGIGIASGYSYGTTENPGTIYFKAEKITAVDEIARSSIQELTNTARKRKTPLKVACFGDSIMWGRDGADNSGGQVATTIPMILSYNLAIDCTNFGVGSQGYVADPDTGAHAGENAYDTISATDLTSYDAVILAYGVNDGYSDLGTVDSSDESTIMGQFNKIINYLYTTYPTIRVIVVAPWNGSNVGVAPDYWYGPRTHSSGYVSRKILSDTLKTRCDYFWIPYIEVYDSPVNPLTINTALPDGVHPNATYYLQIGSWLSGKIGALL